MRNAIINISSENNNGQGNVLMEGDLTLVNAAEIKSILQQALNDFSVLSVKVDNVSSIDLSVIQLLYSLSKSASINNAITIEANLPAPLQTLIGQCGFELLFSFKKSE